MTDQQIRERETLSLRLVRDLRDELVDVLKSLGGRESTGAFDKFAFYSASQVNKAAEAYVLLRQAHRVDACKLLVRPMIEMMFRTRAAAGKPHLFYRIILTERLKRNRWLQGAADRKGIKFDKANEARGWAAFRAHCISKVPDTDLAGEEISPRAIAKAAGFLGYYDSFYAMYCTFTHGSLEAVTGGLDPVSDAYDNDTVALCIFSTIEVLISIGGNSPGFKSLNERMRDRGEQQRGAEKGQQLS